MNVRYWHPMTWVLLIANLVFAGWLIASLGYSDPCDIRGEIVAECAGATRVHQGIGPMRIIGFWLFADLLLIPAWLFARSRRSADSPSVEQGVHDG